MTTFLITVWQTGAGRTSHQQRRVAKVCLVSADTKDQAIAQVTVDGAKVTGRKIADKQVEQTIEDTKYTYSEIFEDLRS